MAIQPNSYRGFRRTVGDATGAQLAILVPDTYRVLHFASAADEATDWNVANPTHPTFYVHSETTPATDYIAFDHDATDGTINIASGNLKLALSGTDEITLTATAFSPTTSDGNALGTTALMWGDLFLASGGVLNFNNGNVTLTHAAGALTLAGGTLTTNSSILSTSATLGIGYGTGAGGTVTQLTSKSTGVTLNTVTGQITMNNAALAADAIVSFTLTNSAIAANDILLLNHHSVATVGAYVFTAQPGTGSAVINVANRSAGSLSEAIVIQYAVIKAVAA